jgi:hypothetical protein
MSEQLKRHARKSVRLAARVFVALKVGVAMKCWIMVLALLLGSCALAQEASPVFHGSFTATAGPIQAFRGAWSGQALPHRPNEVRGSWALISETDQVVLEGTWSAQKIRSGWQGAWTARTKNGQSLSGTWKADLAESSGKTFEDMLKMTAEKEIAGSWRSGRSQGNWRLKGSPPQDRKR